MADTTYHLCEPTWPYKILCGKKAANGDRAYNVVIWILHPNLLGIKPSESCCGPCMGVAGELSYKIHYAAGMQITKGLGV